MRVHTPLPIFVRVLAPAITVVMDPPPLPPRVIPIALLTGVPVMAMVPVSPTMLAAVAKVITPM